MATPPQPPPQAVTSGRVQMYEKPGSQRDLGAPHARSGYAHDGSSNGQAGPAAGSANNADDSRAYPNGEKTRQRPANGAATSSKSQPAETPITGRAARAAKQMLPTEDLRGRLPKFMHRWTGYRPNSKPPYKPLPFLPFSWLAKLPLKYETWILSTIGAFVGIALIEVIISAAFPNDGTILIVASFGASAVLSYGTIESPLAQPRHLVGGQVFSVLIAICITKLMRKSPHYELSDVIIPGELDHIVWINGALSMAASLLLQQITGTVHPPGGATAIIASVQPAAVRMSWRLIYVVLISALVMLVWACIINNVGRRRYPTYWLSGNRTFVRSPEGKMEEESADQARMEAIEGERPWAGSSPADVEANAGVQAPQTNTSQASPSAAAGPMTKRG